MIRCNLAVLLAERGLKISKAAALTGISRTTLTALARNQSQGVQFDTLNSLCLLLKVTPNDLLSHVPIDVGISHIELNGHDDIRIVEGIQVDEIEIDIGIQVKEKSKAVTCLVSGCVKIRHEDRSLHDAEVTLWLDKGDGNGTLLADALLRLPVTFRNDLTGSISNAIQEHVLDLFPPYCEPDDMLPFKFDWPDEFR